MWMRANGKEAWFLTRQLLLTYDVHISILFVSGIRMTNVEMKKSAVCLFMQT